MEDIKDKWVILLKYYNHYWKPYFKDVGWTNTNPSKFHCFDYEYAKNLYDKLCKNFYTSQWLLVKLEELYNASLDEFKYVKEEENVKSNN